MLTPIRHRSIKSSHYHLILLLFTVSNFVLELRAKGLGKEGRVRDIVKESRWKTRREGEVSALQEDR